MSEKIIRPSSVSPGRPGSAVFPTNPLGEKHEGIATGREVEWEPLVDFRRMDISENTIHGAVSWAHGDEIVHSFGGNVLVYGRSMMKPLMMKTFAKVLDDELNWEQKAISCSSHNGDTEHVAAAQSILTESEWGLMQCPLDVPLIQFGRQVRRPRRWFHTCSGEHAAMLKGLRKMGMNRAGYTLPSSPWFPMFLDVLRIYMNKPDWEPLRVAKDEEHVIKKSLDLLRKLSGQSVRSWFGPAGGETEKTPEILKNNGIEFLHDWLIDELPCWMRTKSGPIVAMPYTFELNDVPIWTVQNNSCDEMKKRFDATLKIFEEEKNYNTKIITLALHPHIVGVPQNFYYLKKIIEDLKKRDDVIFMTSSQIGDWFIKEDGTNGDHLKPYLEQPPK